MAKNIAYLRVSTDDKGQEFDRQRYEFEKQGISIDEYFQEKLSGGLDIDRRPALQEAHDCLEKGDTLWVESITRLSRDTLIALALLRDFSLDGIQVKSLSNDIGDVSTPEGWFMTTVMAATSQLQRDTIRKNTIQALQAKKAKGEVLGRPPIYENMDEAIQAVHNGMSPKKAADKYLISLNTLYYHLRKEKGEQ